MDQKLATPKYFVYKKGIYEFDINLFAISSKYFSRKKNDYQNSKFIPIDGEFDRISNLTGDLITLFISFCHNITNNKIIFNFTNENALPIYELSSKFEVETLFMQAEKYISNHYYEIIDINLSSPNDKLFCINKFEKLLSEHLIEFIKDERLFLLQFSSINRIISEYYEKYHMPENDHEINDFLFSCIHHFGLDAALLFSKADFSNESKEFLIQKMYQFSFILNAPHINNIFLKSIFEINRKMENEIQEMKKHYEIETSMFYALSNSKNQELKKFADFVTFISTEKLKSNSQINCFDNIFILDKDEKEYKLKDIFMIKEEICKIGINNEIVEMLFQNQSLDSTEFIEQMKNFSEFKFKLNNSSKNLYLFLTIVSTIKELLLNKVSVNIEIVFAENEECKDILKNLRDIQLYSLGFTKFTNSNFLEKLVHIKISDVPFVNQKIHEGIEIITDSYLHNNKKISTELSLLKIIENIFKEISDKKHCLKSEQENYLLDGEDIQKIDELDSPISKLSLLIKLIRSGCFSAGFPEILQDENFQNIIKISFEMVQNQDLNHFNKFVSLLHSNPNIIPIIDSKFPYRLFDNTSFEMISYWIPLFRKLHENSITFQVIVLNNEYDFVYANPVEFKPTYIFNEKYELILSPLTKFTFELKKEKLPAYSIPPNISNDKLKLRSYLFYGLTCYLINNPTNITQKDFSAQFQFLKNPVPNPRANQLINSLLLQDTESNIIPKIWFCVFVSANKLEECSSLFCYLNSFERDIYQSFVCIYNSLNRSNVEAIVDFSMAMIKFGNVQSYLWKIINNSFMINSQLQIDEAKACLVEIDNEIQDIKNSLAFNIQAWQPNHYIDILEKAEIALNDIVNKK